jgi:hypothetical protein
MATFSISGIGTMEPSTDSVVLSGPLRVFRCVMTYQDTDVAYVQLYHMVASSRTVQHQVVNYPIDLCLIIGCAIPLRRGIKLCLSFMSHLLLVDAL